MYTRPHKHSSISKQEFNKLAKTMNAKMAFPSPFFPPSSTSTTPHKPLSFFLAPRRRPLIILQATNDDNKEQQQQKQQQQPPPITVDHANSNTNNAKTPRTTLNIRYRVRSRNQAKQRKAAAVAPSPPPKKEWDAMTLGEKAVELYVGEKGLLFWLNKFAYASIFIIIGGWILFRFVGPSLGLYQLDSAPLSPSSIFKGSP